MKSERLLLQIHFFTSGGHGINMKLCYEGLKDWDLWASAEVKLPGFDWKAMCLEKSLLYGCILAQEIYSAAL